MKHFHTILRMSHAELLGQTFRKKLYPSRSTCVVLFLGLLLVALACGKEKPVVDVDPPEAADSLRHRYAAPTEKWPQAAWFDAIVKRQELALRQEGPTAEQLGPKKIILGRLLFMDPSLSSNGRSCANICHKPNNYWIDQLPLVVPGITRNTPTMENAWYIKGHLFYDGRAKTYAQQIETAISSPVEMNQDMNALPAKLAALGTYQPFFAAAYGDEAITKDRITEAIAAYSQVIVSGDTRFDSFLKGNYSILNDQEIHGLHLFRTKGKCINCHQGPYFTDMQYHNLGYSSPSSWSTLDSGRYVATGDAADIGKFRTLGLRNVVHTYPYFHNGSLANMKELMKALNAGMPRGSGYVQLGELSPYIKPLNLSAEEIDAIIAFLHTLTSDLKLP